MSKNLASIFALAVLLFFLPFRMQAQATESVDARIESANSAFEAEKYTTSMELYESVYAEGYFNEEMLYRLSYMHENLQNYPQAIYYLKKAAQEYGGNNTENKVKQMMQTQGSTRIFTSDGWNAYFQFFSSWGMIFWIVFGLSVVAVIAHLLIPNTGDAVLRKVGAAVALSLLIGTGAALFHNSFLLPDRAVITEKTSFYDSPSFAAGHAPGIFSIGETVNILDESDIWVLVEAGGREWWVPRMVIREL